MNATQFLLHMDRVKKLIKWLEQYKISMREVARQCGLKPQETQGKTVVYAKSWNAERRNHFLRLGVPEELLPPETRNPKDKGYGTSPNWPNPEVAKHPLAIKERKKNAVHKEI